MPVTSRPPPLPRGQSGQAPPPRRASRMWARCPSLVSCQAARTSPIYHGGDHRCPLPWGASWARLRRWRRAPNIGRRGAPAARPQRSAVYHSGQRNPTSHPVPSTTTRCPSPLHNLSTLHDRQIRGETRLMIRHSQGCLVQVTGPRGGSASSTGA